MGRGRPYAYNLDHEPIGFEEAGRLLADPTARHVRASAIDTGMWVSTVFLVIDHNYDLTDARPVLYESMVVADDDWHGEDMRRYRTREEAEQGHDELVAAVREWASAR